MTRFYNPANPTLTNPLEFKGSIAVAADFPTLATVKTGWLYKITADVTDNDASKTNTGQSFNAGDEIAWNGINWSELGSVDLWNDTSTKLEPINARTINIQTGEQYQINAVDLKDFTEILTNKTINPSSNSIILSDANILVGNNSNIAAGVTMSGEASIINTGAITLDNNSVIAKNLTGFVSGAGVVSASDSIISAIEKLDGNIIIADVWQRITGTPNYVIPKTAADEIGATAARITKGWFTDLEITNMLTVNGTSINANAVLDLTSTEVIQLANIDSVTISNAQWGYLGALDQGIAKANSPQFSGITLTGNIDLSDPGTSVNSYKINLISDNGGTPQTGSLQVIYGADPYLRISVPNDSGIETSLLDLHDTVLAFVTDNTVNIGASGANRPKDLYLSGSAYVGSTGIAGTADLKNSSDVSKVKFDTEGASYITGGYLGIGITTPSTRLEVETATDEADAAITIDQNDADEPFINYQGTSSADQTNNISTVNGDGAIEGPKNYSSTAGWAYDGMLRINVNGTDYWMPYYSADLS